MAAQDGQRVIVIGAEETGGGQYAELYRLAVQNVQVILLGNAAGRPERGVLGQRELTQENVRVSIDQRRPFVSV